MWQYGVMMIGMWRLYEGEEQSTDVRTEENTICMYRRRYDTRPAYQDSPHPQLLPLVNSTSLPSTLYRADWMSRPDRPNRGNRKTSRREPTSSKQPQDAIYPALEGSLRPLGHPGAGRALLLRLWSPAFNRDGADGLTRPYRHLGGCA